GIADIPPFATRRSSDLDLLSIDFIRYIFDEELKCHYTWITGCGHLNFSSEMSKPSTSGLPIPKNMQELTFNILIEQILTRNIHRSEEHTSELQSRFDLV